MKIKHLGLALLATLVVSGFAFAEDQFRSYGLEQAGKFLANPPQFIYEFQRNMESTNPLPPGKMFGLNYHFLGGIVLIPLPDVTTAGNLSAKIRVHPEGRLIPGFPQVDVVGGYWNCIPSSLLEDKSAKPTDTDTKITKAELSGYYSGLVVTSSLEP